MVLGLAYQKSKSTVLEGCRKRGSRRNEKPSAQPKGVGSETLLSKSRDSILYAPKEAIVPSSSTSMKCSL
jgi:hypothetical protein